MTFFQLRYWGNLRFAKKSFEEQPLEADIGRDRSVLSYVDIEGAGMLHGEKVCVCVCVCVCVYVCLCVFLLSVLHSGRDQMALW